jgi:hypothetical protein
MEEELALNFMSAIFGTRVIGARRGRTTIITRSLWTGERVRAGVRK